MVNPMNDSADDLAALTRRLEANEIVAWRSMFQSPAPDVAARLGIGCFEQAGAIMAWNRAAPVPMLNRVLALGVFEPATDQVIDAFLARSIAERVRCEVQVAPATEPPDLAARLAARGMRTTLDWLMHYYTLDAPPPAPVLPVGYSIEVVTAANAAIWADAFLRGWDFPPRAASGPLAIMVGLVDRPGWTCFAAIHKPSGSIAGCGALFIDNGVAGLYSDGVPKEHRRRGLQVALIAARLEEAYRQGCTIACTQTLADHVAQRNMARAGFRVAYRRPNYVLEKRGG